MSSPQAQFNYQHFIALLERLGVSEQVLDPHILSGLALAITVAPDLIDPEEWFPLAFLDESGDVAEPQFRSEDDADTFYQQLLMLTDYWNGKLSEESPLQLPAEYCLDADGEPSTALRDFCDGVLIGFDWLDEVWTEVLEEVAEVNGDLGDVFDSTLVACLLLNDPVTTRASLLETDGIIEEDQMTFEEAIEVFRTGILIVANFSRDVVELLEDEAE
ncbi:MAG: hypothetical protein VR73_10785 [Gammaproteobacteria bacterium BRH_c0]|nr:MAG: hypothetical protein VR73_10785 [Gammaproteobacteria bacterium BRH_c0]